MRVCLLAVFLVLPVTAQMPDGYEVIRQFGRPCRIATLALPWRVASSDPQMSAVVNQALAAWNAEGLRLGLGPFFAPVLPGEPVDLTIDWSGRDLPSDKAAGVFWDAGLGYTRVLRLVMDGRFRVPDGNRTQILMQEFGHVLGLGHSRDRQDVMYEVMMTRRVSRPSGVRLTERDRAALSWLYGQPEWVPILAPGQPFVRPLMDVSPVPMVTPVP